MSHTKKKFTRKVGFPPETLIYTGDKKVSPDVIQLVKFNDLECELIESSDISVIKKSIDTSKINWININTLYNVDLIESIGRNFNIHFLLLEDILNSEHLPKMEESSDQLFLTLKHLSFSASENKIEVSHLSFVLGEHFLISFSEEDHDIFSTIRENIISNRGKIRKRRADYLMYILFDAIVDNYYLILDSIQDKLEDIEDRLIDNKSYNLINEIHNHKKLQAPIRKSILPLTEAANKLLLEESKFIEHLTLPYFRDVLDHLIQISDIFETNREMIAGLIDLNMSNINNNMNNVMKTLTIVSTIFIPLTFLVGLYGMNFKHMPEIGWKYSYPLVLVFMLVTSMSMVIIMKRKKWF